MSGTIIDIISGPGTPQGDGVKLEEAPYVYIAATGPNLFCVLALLRKAANCSTTKEQRTAAHV